MKMHRFVVIYSKNWVEVCHKDFRKVILLCMQYTLAHIGPRSPAGDEFNALTQLYLDRTAAFVPCEAMSFRKQEDLLEWLSRRHGKVPLIAVLLDSRGRHMTSEAFASWLAARRDEGGRHIVFAIGPADGWSGETRTRAQLLLSLGPMTIAHALARLVMAEQLYRACTILAGHPYHTGH
jgi:23S rRNA (pseudouridine1915-N3)-methyltransferase